MSAAAAAAGVRVCRPHSAAVVTSHHVPTGLLETRAGLADLLQAYVEQFFVMVFH